MTLLHLGPEIDDSETKVRQHNALDKYPHFCK